MIAALCAATASGLALAALAEPDDQSLAVDGVELVTEIKASDEHPLDMLYSGWRFRTDETQALQTDDFDNPAFIFVEQAVDAWDTVEGEAGKSCAECHGAVEESMKGVRAGMPKWDAEAGEVWSVENFVNRCRTERMQAEPWKWDKADMNAMAALIGLQSRGMPVDVDVSGPAEPWFKRGEEMYYTRYGQLELSCASCHEENYGNMIRADHLSQGHINGFPTYRLKNTKLNSVHGRFKGCIRDTRAHTFKPGSEEFRALELYVAWRGEGLAVETPSVRQ
ncbi:MAG: sulfur oxidation c-type cytochrome SoxA [Rhodobacteraceae bacterium]|nr:sulfur oxidation c-type cytochrome SoxA [Paracoccaceae bacterium]